VLRILPEPPIWKAVLGFDFDDTLVLKKGKGIVDTRFFDCVAWVRSTYGAAWGIATGRSLYQLVEGFNDARFPFLPDFVIAREREIYFPGQFGRWVPHDDWNEKCERDHHRLFRKSKRVLGKVRKFVEGKTDARWVSVEGDAAGIVSTSHEEMNEIQDFIESLSKHSDLTHERNSVYLRFSHRNFSKGSGLVKAAERWGIGPDHILAVGDNLNDLSMLQPEICDACGCPSNAVSEVRDFVQARGGKVASKPGSAGVIEVMGHYFDP
jgi:hydroxymethylpyrimidine pyrophosphatase-like HAD family hydrolase